MALSLPQDIILLLGKELASRRDFPTLFRFAQVSRRFASVGLEQLYSIYEMSPVMQPDNQNVQGCARVWQSILGSSIGVTIFPYCAYIRALALGNYETLLNDINDNKDVRSRIFDPNENMDQFLIVRGTNSKRTRTHLLAPIDIDGSMTKAGEAITKLMKESADETGTTVTLAHLEANRVPTDLLSTWISRLVTLTSLRLQDGSVLDAAAGTAIFQSCPNFSDLTVLHCSGGKVDENMAEFLQTLRPNTLKLFTVLSYNDLGGSTMTALNAHAESLKVLRLGSMSTEATECLNVLRECTALECLDIENRHRSTTGRQDKEIMGYLNEISVWIQNCKNLKILVFTNIIEALHIVMDVLDSPSVKLDELSLKGFGPQSAEHTSAAWASLGYQENLTKLTLDGDGQDELLGALSVHESPGLTDAICKLVNLQYLDLTKAFLRMQELDRFTAKLPNLTELRFGGEWVNDGVFDSLICLEHLKVLVIDAVSIFSWGALKVFVKRLQHYDHSGIRIDIMRQSGSHQYTEDQVAWITKYVAETLNGNIYIAYWQDPDEEHEGDFSDLSD